MMHGPTHIKIGFVCFLLRFQWKAFSRRRCSILYFHFFIRTAHSGIQNRTGIETGTVESGELSGFLVTCNKIFKLQLLSEPLFPLDIIIGNTNGRVRIRVSSKLRMMCL